MTTPVKYEIAKLLNKTDFDFIINDVCYNEILFDTYEQAEDACIDKIIELLKNK